MKASEALRGCRCGLSISDGVKSLCSGLGAVLDDERQVVGKRTYFTTVVIVV
jgi:hypothetical protein